jgi:hypothetical protein
MYAECECPEKQISGPEYVDFCEFFVGKLNLYVNLVKAQLVNIDDAFCSPNTYEVVNAYFGALTCVFPELRYHPGTYAKLLFFPLQYLSTRAQDFIYRLLSMSGPQEPQPPKLKSA